MKKLLLSLLLLQSILPMASQSDCRLWYDKPATGWNEALPVGNGRLGAMIFSDPVTERIQLNEESLWAGSPGNNNNPAARQSLPQIRRLILDDSLHKAVELADKTFLGIPPRIRSYQPLCDLTLNFGARQITGYTRELNLNTGVCRTQYTADNTTYTQDVFASSPDNIIVIRLKAQGNGRINTTIGLTRARDARVRSEQNEIILTGQIVDKDDPQRGAGGPHMRFQTRLKASNRGGKISNTNQGLKVEQAQELVLILTAATDYQLQTTSLNPQLDLGQTCETILNRINIYNYTTLYSRHLKEYAALFNRVKLHLGGTGKAQDRPTDERLSAVKKGGDDPQLVALYFQYGRYLLMSSSRYPGILPANLQGIWNESATAPWNSDFHTNINLQMNYWPAEICNLSETTLPLVGFIKQVAQQGEATARQMYGARGWTLHHLTDVFGRTGVMDGVQWGLFPMAGPWITFPIYEHFLFTQDTGYLRESGYPLMKSSAQFVLDYLIRDKAGRWVTAPSNSPENSFRHPSGESYRMTYAATMDIQIITELFKNCIDAARQLNIDRPFADTLKSVLSDLPPAQISARTGGIQEWIEDYEEAEPGHRHMSHLLGLYPGNQITRETPELFAAAKKSLENRLSHGGGHTGWSRAWIVNFYARLGDHEEAYKHILALLAKSTQSNLLDTHPPFQIDGNFGGTAGIAEMLLQSHRGTVTLLPALPDAWPDGEISGLRARGGSEISIRWQQGKLYRATLIAHNGGMCRIRYRQPFCYKKKRAERNNEFYELNIQTEKGHTYTLTAPAE